MYIDKDSGGRYAIMDLGEDDLETLRRALTAFRVGLLQSRLPAGFAPRTEPDIQYRRAGKLVKLIENK